MRKSRCANEQVIAVLKEAEAGASSADVWRRHGISDQTFYRWKAKFGGMDVSEARRLKDLEEENSRLKRMVADLSLDNQALKDLVKKMVSPEERRAAVEYLRTEYRLPQRRACALVGQPRSSQRSCHRRAEMPGLRERLVGVAHERRRFGYPRL